MNTHIAPSVRYRVIAALAVSAIVFSGCSAQNPEINRADVERIITTLSADDMEGRRTFEPGIEKAARFLASADAYFDSLGIQIQKGGGSDILVERIRETLREKLGEDVYESMYQAGHAISIDEVVAEALSSIDEAIL